MARVDRARYVPAKLQAYARADEALPIGHGQTISQPTMVKLLVEALDLDGVPRPLDRVLAATADAGSRSHRFPAPPPR